VPRVASERERSAAIQLGESVSYASSGGTVVVDLAGLLVTGVLKGVVPGRVFGALPAPGARVTKDA